MSIFFIFKNFEHQNFKPQVGTSLTVYLQITFLYIYICAGKDLAHYMFCHYTY